jgi:hypothetical protein
VVRDAGADLAEGMRMVWGKKRKPFFGFQRKAQNDSLLVQLNDKHEST